MCAMNVEIVLPNLAALRDAVFTLSGKNLRGGGADNRPLPVGARVSTIILIPTNYEDLQYSPSFTENWYEQVMFLGLSTHENKIH